MKNADRLVKLAQEQFGSRKNSSKEKHALNKQLMLDDIMRLTKKPDILTANNAKSCHDQILHFTAYAALRRAGISKKVIISMVHTLHYGGWNTQ